MSPPAPLRASTYERLHAYIRMCINTAAAQHPPDPFLDLCSDRTHPACHEQTSIMVWPGDGATTPPSPTPVTTATPAPAVQQPVTPTGTSDLTPVGLIPLADCTGCSGEDLLAFYAKVCATVATTILRSMCVEGLL